MDACSLEEVVAKLLTDAAEVIELGPKHPFPSINTERPIDGVLTHGVKFEREREYDPMASPNCTSAMNKHT